MFRNLAFLTIWLALAACNGTNPPPPPPPVCELTPADCPSGVVDLDACECVAPEPPPPPPPCGIDPADCQSGQVDDQVCECVPPQGTNPPTGDYINLDRVDDIIHGTAGQPGLGTPEENGLLDHELTWAGWRDPLNVATNCPDDVGYIGFESVAALAAFGEHGAALKPEGERIVARLPIVNKRCPTTHEDHNHPGWVDDPAFCGRSDVRKARLADYRVGTEASPGLDPHLARAELTRSLAARCAEQINAAGGGSYDSIAGWCSSLRKAKAKGFTLADCPR